MSASVGSERTLQRSQATAFAGFWRFECTILSQVTLVLRRYSRQQVLLWLDMQVQREECAKRVVVEHRSQWPGCLPPSSHDT